MRCLAIVVTTAITLATPHGARSAPAPCAITEGSGIAGVRLGMATAAALATTGGALGQAPDGGEIVYTLRPPLARMVVANGVVVRVSTQSPECATAAGVRPGAPRAALAAAYASAMASIVTPLADGEQVAYPFAGIRFAVRADRVYAVEVFSAESLPRTAAPASPSAPSSRTTQPGPTAPAGAWTIASASYGVDGTTLNVTGTAENRGPASNVFADVVAYDGSGSIVGRGSAPLMPSPVPTGGRARFEVGVPITDVVRRYTVDLRPAGSAGISLARYAAGIVSIAPFGALVVPHLKSDVRPTRVPSGTWEDLALAVTNNSGYSIASVLVEVELRVVCRVDDLPGRRILHRLQHTGRDRVGPVAPGATAQFALSIATDARSDCPVFVYWSATTRILTVDLADERRATDPRSQAALAEPRVAVSAVGGPTVAAPRPSGVDRARRAGRRRPD
jgi:hypothetical protein